jgi:sigma-E factor negative regulatory protein RseB
MPRMRWCVVALLAALIGAGSVYAQAGSSRDGAGLREWLVEVNRAAANQRFVGTMTIRSERETAAAKIWHWGNGREQYERVDLMTGEAQTTFRRNNEVLQFDHSQKQLRVERRDDLGLFPAVLKAPGNTVGQHYVMQSLGQERVAGEFAAGTALQAKDPWRHSFRIWRSVQTGLVLKWQTLARPEGPVLEEVAYSDMMFGAATGLTEAQMRDWMAIPAGYEVVNVTTQGVDTAQRRWLAPQSVPGFHPISAMVAHAPTDGARGAERQGTPLTQWVFSDGLSSASLFITKRQGGNGTAAAIRMGATSSVAKQVGAYWITAVGEVPVATLHALIDGVGLP